MEVLKIFQMDEPISKKLLPSQNSRSLNSSFKHSKVDQLTEMDKLRKQLIIAQSENLTLQKELSSTVNEEAENKEKLVELTKKLRELERKHEELLSHNTVNTKPKGITFDEIISLENKVLILEHKNRDLEAKLKKLHQITKENEEKDNIIKLQKDKLIEIESKLKQNENTSCAIDKIGDAGMDNREIEFQKVMLEYEELLGKVLTERQTLLDDKNTVQNHLANLELAFNDLLQKYERAKKIVEGFKKNEEILRGQMTEWTKTLNNFDKKYTDLKMYAEKKISQANVTILNKNKGNIEEVAKLKAKILQSQVKINELEKHIKPNEIETVSLFAPLKNDLKRKH
ncbi:hypothetical protein HHI36_010742 [Cryptolaemus montrouzieri]|uniref:Transforming acidic coiled-coil-containing protein C-terminal domain-containing protein n=1 Tax=Cryptolaemus montrouzieri TaxID=559131 RepID=A0ABD2MJP8_9CUCU